MAATATLGMLAAHPEWIPPRSDVRVFLGEPGGPEACKTTVEPGNSFSPGMGTFGVTWWLRLPATNAFFAPELAPLSDLHWRYADGYLPILTCQTAFANLDITYRLLQDGTTLDTTESVCGEITITNGWSQAEFWLLQRAMLVEEWGDVLLFLAGAPKPWLADGKHITLRHFPTAYGLLTLQATDETTQVAITIAGIIPGTVMTVRLLGCAVAILVATADVVTIHVQKNATS